MWMLLLAGFSVLVLTGCELKDNGDNLVNGKTLFVEKCSACHTLARAGAKGVVGPNLDEAWQQAEKDGFGRSTFAGIVHRQILHPNRHPQIDPATGKPLPLMPADLVTGEDAQDVAAYVGVRPPPRGEDTGRLAQAGAAKQEDLAKAEGGTLDIPADPSGRTLYTFKNAEAPAGQLTINSRQRVRHRPRHRGRGRRREREGRDRQGRRHVDDRRRPEARRVHVLLLRATATARPAWRASSPSSSGAGPLGGLVAVVLARGLHRRRRSGRRP